MEMPETRSRPEVVGVMSSARLNGNTATLVREALKGAEEFETVKALLRGADGIILSSPTYGGAPNAIMKNLLDRLGLFERFTSATFGGKYVVGMSTADHWEGPVKGVYLNLWQRGMLPEL